MRAGARWFAEHYPKTKSYTVNTHMEGLSGNNSVQKHQPRRTALRRNPATYKFSACRKRPHGLEESYATASAPQRSNGIVGPVAPYIEFHSYRHL